MRGGNLFPNQLPGMDMIKQDGDAARVRNGVQAQQNYEYTEAGVDKVPFYVPSFKCPG